MVEITNKKITRIILVFAGAISLIWFLIRVIPKPSRATYPCQRIAFPLASAFVIWLTTIISSITIFKRARHLLKSKPLTAAITLLVAFGIFVISFFTQPLSDALSNTIETFDPELVEKVPLKALTEPVIDTLLTKVSIVKSDRTDADDITYGELEIMIRQAVELSGGLNAIVSDGDKVLLKPNLVTVDEKDLTEYYGHITHNWVVEIAAKIVRELNPTGRIFILENSYFKTNESFASLRYDTLKYIDSYAAIDSISGDWQEYTSSSLQAVSLPDELSLYPDASKPNKSRPIYLNKEYYEADVIISLPVLKNHRSTGITGAVKNVSIGCAPGNIYGDNPSNSRPNDRSVGIDHDDLSTNKLHRWIHDFYMCRKVDFAIVDGIEGMERGPGGCIDCQKNMRLILAGRDPIAVDAISGLLMKHDPSKVNYLVYLHNDNQGIANPALIDVVGESVKSSRKYFAPARAQTEYSQFSKVNCYYSTSLKLSEDTLYIVLNNLDADIARISVNFTGDRKSKYVVGGFDNVKIPLKDLDVSSGEVKLRIEDKYLNSYSFTQQIESNSTSIILKDSHKFEMKIYPNPASSYINIDLPDYHAKAMIRILNYKGETLKSKFYSGESARIDISDLEPGMYFVILRDNNHQNVQQAFIKN